MKLFPDDTWAVATIWAEARGENFAGKLAVAEVILNRTRRSYSSDGTIAGTCLWPMQFSSWNAKDKNRLKVAQIDSQDSIVTACEQAWKQARAGSMTVCGAVLYFAPATLRALGLPDPTWATSPQVQFVATIGLHQFYTVAE